MDIVLGVSMTPTTVRMALVEGEKADGVTVDHDVFDISAVEGSATPSAAEQVVAAVLGTQESATAGGHHLTAIGVAWSDHAEAATLRDALAARGLDDVMLVSELHAAGALAQAVGRAVGYDSTALLFIERHTATMSVVRTGDGSVVKVLSRSLHSADAMAVLTELASAVDGPDSPAQGMFIVGSGVAVGEVKAHLEKLINLPVHAPDESELALCRGAALAAAQAPAFEASTVGLAYSQDPDDGPTAGAGLVADLTPDFANSYALFAGADTQLAPADGPAPGLAAGPVDEDRKPFLLVGSALTSIFVVGVVALVISLAVSIRPTVDQRPSPAESALAPSVPIPAEPEAVPEAQPVLPVQPPAPPPETIQAPVPVVQEAPRAPAPQAPRTVFVERAHPAPQAPAPAPEAPPPAAPPPVPVAPIPVPAPAIVPPAPQPPVVFWPRSQYPNWVPRPTWTPPRPTWIPPQPTWIPPAPPQAPSPGWPMPREERGSGGGPGFDGSRSGGSSSRGDKPRSDKSRGEKSRGDKHRGDGPRGGGPRGGNGDNPFWPFG